MKYAMNLPAQTEANVQALAARAGHGGNLQVLFQRSLAFYGLILDLKENPLAVGEVSLRGQKFRLHLTACDADQPAAAAECDNRALKPLDVESLRRILELDTRLICDTEESYAQRQLREIRALLARYEAGAGGGA